MEIVTQWKVSFAFILRYLIINNPMSPDVLYQDQSDKTPREVKWNLTRNQFIGSLSKADNFDHANW